MPMTNEWKKKVMRGLQYPEFMCCNVNELCAPQWSNTYTYTISLIRVDLNTSHKSELNTFTLTQQLQQHKVKFIKVESCLKRALVKWVRVNKIICITANIRGFTLI